MQKLSRLSRTTLLLSLLFGFDKILAFARSILIARQFKLSAELDAFNVANNLPDLLFALISGGAIAMAFIPILSEYLTLQGYRAAWNLFSKVVNLALIATIILAIFVALFAEPIVGSQIGIAPGFNSQQQHLIAQLMRLNLIATCIFSVSGLVMAGLQANQHFLMPALAPILYNVGQIIAVLILAPVKPYVIGSITLPALGLGVHGLVYGVIIGAMLHLFIQVPALLKYQFRWNPSISLKDPGLIKVLRVVGPRLVTIFCIQLIFIARDNFASRLGQVGAASSLTYGWMIMQVPETLLGTALATALLPTLAEHAVRKNWNEFKLIIERATRVLLALSLPIAAVLAATIKPLISIAFNFGDSGNLILTRTVQVYLLLLTGYCLQELLARAFYARKEALIPLYGSIIRIAVYLISGVFFVRFFKYAGPPAIAAAELAIIVETIFQFIVLRRRLPERIIIGKTLVRGILAAVIGGGGALLLVTVLPGPIFLTSMVGMLVGLLASFGIIYPEFKLLFKI